MEGKEEVDLEEKMESETGEKEKMEENTADVTDDGADLLASTPGEEEEEEEMADEEEKAAKELLMDEEGTTREGEDEVRKESLEEEAIEVKEEQRVGEITTFKSVKDPSDPLNVNHTNNFENLAIEDPKDTQGSGFPLQVGKFLKNKI